MQTMPQILTVLKQSLKALQQARLDEIAKATRKIDRRISRAKEQLAWYAALPACCDHNSFFLRCDVTHWNFRVREVVTTDATKLKALYQALPPMALCHIPLTNPEWVLLNHTSKKRPANMAAVFIVEDLHVPGSFGAKAAIMWVTHVNDQLTNVLVVTESVVEAKEKLCKLLKLDPKGSIQRKWNDPRLTMMSAQTDIHLWPN